MMNHWTSGALGAEFSLEVEVEGYAARLRLRPLSESYRKTWICDLADSAALVKKRSATFKAETVSEAEKKAEALALSWGAAPPRGHRGPK